MFWNFLAEPAPDAGGGGCTGGSAFTFILLGVMLVAMYFLMIRPQKKQAREVEDMRANLQVGDEITTIGGIIGKIVSIKDETVLVETGRDKVRIRFLRSAIRSVDVKAEDAE